MMKLFENAVPAGMAQAVPQLAPICEAVEAGLVNLAVLLQGDPNDSFSLPDPGKPVIAYIADDTDRADGPAGWDRLSLEFLAYRCYGAAVMIAMDERVYSLAVHEAVSRRRDMLIVESRLEYEADWVNFLREANPGLALMLCANPTQSE